jgi:molybdate transport system regulatory protein
MTAKNASPDLTQALGSEVADKRLDILRRLGEVGSISQAARSAGVSYKAAWQALETLSNLAGTPLLEKVVGGAGGGGARLTEAGQQVLEGAEKLAQARAAVLAALQKNASPANTLPNLRGLGLRTSMRNNLPCTIHRLDKVGGTVRALLDLGDGQFIAARITQESAQLLGLAPGMRVLALCKATGVKVGLKLKAQDGLNRIDGKVTRVSRSLKGGEVSIQTRTGHQWVGFAPPQSGLQTGMSVSATVEESAVVIALPD